MPILPYKQLVRMLVMAMPAKVEVEVATAPHEVCLGRGWSTALYVSSKGSKGCSKIGLVSTVIELVSRVFLTRQHSMNTRRHSFHSLMRELANDAVCASKSVRPSSNTSLKWGLYD
jgi:hypothetical protein